MALAARLDNSGNFFIDSSLFFDEVTITSTNYAASFNGTSQYLSIPASTNWAFGTGDFTIEWWQYMTTQNSNPRVFSVGTYPTASIAVSIEGGTFYFWENNSYRFSFSLTAGGYLNQWVHFAISRVSNSTKVFKNGTQIGSSYVDNNNITNSSTILTISQESSTTASGSYFTGSISNFRILKGTGLYTANFIPSRKPMTAITNTVLLICQSSTFVDNSTYNATITNGGTATISTTTPFNTVTSLVNGSSYQVANTFDEVTINPINTGVARKISNTGIVQIAGIFDEVTGIV